MSALLGLNMPQNSVGKLPLDYLKIHDEDKIEAKLANGLQVHEQYLAMKAKRTNTWLPAVISRADPFNLDLAKVLSTIENLKRRAKYNAALDLADQLHEQSLQALFHYQRYHRLPLYIASSFTYVGFIIYIILTLLKVSTSYSIMKGNFLKVIFCNLTSIYASVSYSNPGQSFLWLLSQSLELF